MAAELRLKRTSYPSRQKRFGPAPLASFEDLSDEIPSPDNFSPEESTAEARDAFELTPDLRFELSGDRGNETEDDVRTFSDGITPSTPRVLAQTPSTPLFLRDFSTAGTPDSLGQSTSLIGGFDLSPPNDVSSPKRVDDPYNIFSPRPSPVLERRPVNLNVDVVQDRPIITQVIDPAAERALAAALERAGDSHSIIDGNSSKDQSNLASSGTGSIRSRPGSGTGSGSRVGSATPSPRSARKLFSMSFFKAREDRSPSPIASPKSPLKLSPMASPKSPRKSSPFVISLFRSHPKDDGDHSPSSSSPTRRKSHFPSFLRGKETVKSPVQDPTTGPGLTSAAVSGKKEGGKHGQGGVFSTLFRRDHKDTSRLVDGKTPEEEEWISFSRSHNLSQSENINCEAISKEAIDTEYGNEIASTSSPVELYHGGIYINIFERQSPPDTQIINIENQPDTQLLNELLPDLNGRDNVNVFESTQDISNFCIPPDQYDPSLRLGLSPSSDLVIHDETKSEQRSEVIVIPSTMTVSVEEEKVAKTQENGKSVAEEKLSPESEREVSESESTVVLKYAKSDEPEAETLLREDSFENENDSSSTLSALMSQIADSERENELNEISKRRERIAKFQPHPVDRPRSILPVSYSSFEEYVNFVSSSPPAGATAAEDSSTSITDGDSDVSSKAKLKVTLPRDEFQLRQRQSRKSLFKSWVEFCEVGLQSPRSRRRHLSDKSSRSPSSVPASRTTTVEEDVERRTESLDYTLTGTGCEVWTTFEATHSVVRHTREISFESDVFAISNSDSKLGSVDLTETSSVKSPAVDTSPLTYCFESHSDSSRSSSPKELVDIRENSAFLLNLGDEEVEPLVKEVLSRDVSRDYLVAEATCDSPYATTTPTTTVAPTVVPVQRFDEDDDKFVGHQWWAGDGQSLVSVSKQQISDMNVIESHADVVGFPETNGKSIDTKDDS